MESSIAKKKLYELLIPSMLMCMAGNLSAIFDSVFISSFVNLEALGAIQLLMPLISIIAVLEWVFGLGGQIIALNKKSEFDEEGSNTYYTISIISVLVFSSIFSIICFLNTDTLLVLLNSTPKSLPYIHQYLPFLLINIPITCFVAILTQFIRVDGQAKFASFILVLANVINVALNYIFLVYFNMGVMGASIATLVGYAVSALVCFKYLFDSNRTFNFVNIFHSFKSLISKFVNICKVGFPGASIELSFVLIEYFMNFVLAKTLFDQGLAMYTICTDYYLLLSVILIGFAEALSSLIPVYYSQDDYTNVKFLFRKSFIIMMIASIIFTLFIWISPDTFLSLYNVHTDIPAYETALRLFSVSFIFQVLSTILIFYYESIERIFIAAVLSFMNILIGPIIFVMLLLPVMGTNIIWLSFTFACILSLFLVYVYVKLDQRKETEYDGFLFVKKELAENSKNYEINAENKVQITQEIFNYIENLGVYEESYKNFKEFLDKIFEYNDNDVVIEVLLIKQDDKLKINIKDNGKEDILDKIGGEFKDKFKYNKVLGLNSLETNISI